MKKINKDLVIVICFYIVVLIIFISTPFICIKFCEKSYAKFIEENRDLEVVENEIKKIDESRDYIYFINEEVLEGYSFNKYPIINLTSDDAKTITEELKSYVDNIRNISKEEIDDSKCYYYVKNRAINYLDYSIYEAKEYITLFIKRLEYSYMDKNSIIHAVKSYTFNKIIGKYLDFNELIEMYNIAIDELIEKINAKLNNDQTILEDIPNIKIEETMSEIINKGNYAIYIDEYEDLVINFIVKTNSVDYNDSIKINR